MKIPLIGAIDSTSAFIGAVVAMILTPILVVLFASIKRFILRWGGYLFDGVAHYCARYFHSGLAGTLTLKQYCRLRLAEENRYLFVPSRGDIKLELDEAFITLQLESSTKSAEHLDHTNVLSTGSRLRVVGDPGSGKSSLVKKLLRDTCRQALKQPRTTRLPVLIELKKLQVPEKKIGPDLGVWFLQKLKAEVKRSNVFRIDECFDAYAEGPGLLVLLDGLDEVSSAHYPKVQAAIDALSTKLSQVGIENVMVLTMRTQFHHQVKDSYRDSFGQAYFLQSFSPSDVYEFLRRWPFSYDRENEIARIFKELTDRPSLREMCSNPLVLAMYVAEDQARGNLVAPDSRTDFYRLVTDELIIKRRLAQTGPVAAYGKVRELRVAILGRLAFEHMINETEPANSLGWTRAISITRSVAQCSEQEAEILFREIAKETGLVSEERPSETLRFIHLTFCEFLAAVEASQGRSEGWGTLIGAHQKFQTANEPHVRSRLLEVIPFACGLIQKYARASAIEDVRKVMNKGLLARTFLETKSYDHPAWPSFVEEWKLELLSVPASDWDEEWLKALHLFNVVMVDANQCAVHAGSSHQSISAAFFFEQLLSNKESNLKKLLEAYASQDAAAAFRMAELTQLNLAVDFPEVVIRNCDQPPFLALVLDQAGKESQRKVFWARLLVEAALRSRIVAAQLLMHEPISTWGAKNEKAHYAWDSSPLMRISLYSQCLALCQGSSEIFRAQPLPEDLPELSSLWASGSFVRPRGWVHALERGLIISAASSLAVLIPVLVFSPKTAPLVGLAPVIVAMLIAIAYFLAIQEIARAVVSRTALNLPSSIGALGLKLFPYEWLNSLFLLLFIRSEYAKQRTKQRTMQGTFAPPLPRRYMSEKQLISFVGIFVSKKMVLSARLMAPGSAYYWKTLPSNELDAILRRARDEDFSGFLAR